MFYGLKFKITLNSNFIFYYASWFDKLLYNYAYYLTFVMFVARWATLQNKANIGKMMFKGKENSNSKKNQWIMHIKIEEMSLSMRGQI